jgi:hypothetical protein
MTAMLGNYVLRRSPRGRGLAPGSTRTFLLDFFLFSLDDNGVDQARQSTDAVPLWDVDPANRIPKDYGCG